MPRARRRRAARRPLAPARAAATTMIVGPAPATPRPARRWGKRWRPPGFLGGPRRPPKAILRKGLAVQSCRRCRPGAWASRGDRLTSPRRSRPPAEAPLFPPHTRTDAPEGVAGMAEEGREAAGERGGGSPQRGGRRLRGAGPGGGRRRRPARARVEFPLQGPSPTGPQEPILIPQRIPLADSPHCSNSARYVTSGDLKVDMGTA